MTPKEQLDLAVRLAKEGALRSKIVRDTGLTAAQVEEIKKRVRQ